MILATSGGDREVRDLFASTAIIPPPYLASGTYSAAGRYVDFDSAQGLPAVMAAIRLLSETVASLPLIVYRESGEVREKATDSFQWELLHEEPNDVQTAFEFQAFMLASLQGHGNAYALKAKAQGTLVGLYPIEPQRVVPRVDGGSMAYDVTPPNGGKPQTLSRDALIHIPGILTSHPYIGVSPVRAHVQALGQVAAIEEFGARYFSDDATPSGVIQAPGDTTKAQRDEMRESWEARHRGIRGSHKLGLLIGGSTYQQVGVNAQDAQLIDAAKFSVEQVGRMFRVPARLIGGADQEPRMTSEQKNMDFLTFSLAPWLVRNEQRYRADQDLFPELGRDDDTLFPEYLADGLLRADTAARYGAYVQARQAGWLSANEIRAKENYPPVEGGDEVQATPVGGAPNPTGGTPPANEPVEPAGPAT